MALQPELYIGKVAEITFVDHVWGDKIEDVMLCRIWGKIIKSDWQRVVVQVWETNRSEDDNAEYAIIIRAAVTSIRPLTYEKRGEE